MWCEPLGADAVAYQWAVRLQRATGAGPGCTERALKRIDCAVHWEGCANAVKMAMMLNQTVVLECWRFNKTRIGRRGPWRLAAPALTTPSRLLSSND